MTELHQTLIKSGLSHRESEVAMEVAGGVSNKEVANKLFVTEKTVKFHLTNIYKKMQVKSRTQLIVMISKWKSQADFIETKKLIVPESPIHSLDMLPSGIKGNRGNGDVGI